MGFRDIHAFNLAMLVKQAWSLIHETHLLFYRVYKACYFPSYIFMEAELETNPSFVWRSLLQAREMIREGSVWQVGNRQQININTHKWLLRPPVFREGADWSLKVANLIDTNMKEWNTT